MPISSQSWEFIFVFNLIVVVFLPLLLKPSNKIQNTRYRIFNSVLLRLCFLGFIPIGLASLGYYALNPLCDLSFHNEIIFWHLGISLINLGLLWKLIEIAGRTRTRTKDYYIIVSISGAVSFSALLWTPSLAFTDLYWGVVPGTISLDPIISLPPYYLRAWVTLMVCLVLIKWRKPWVQWPAACFAFALIGLFAPSPFLRVQTLQRQFKEHANLGPIHIHIEDPTLEEFSAETWAKEFQFHLEHLLKRLPLALQPTAPQIQKFNFNIFIYASDDSKNRWIHARQTQIGHFPRGEMHLSHLDPSSPIIGHELAHLLHGQLSAPLKSYIDPFYFEGFAVALSDPSPENAIDDAAAMAKTLPQNYRLMWPRYLKFYYAFPARTSYAFAGGHGALAIQQKLAPWDFDTDSIENLLSRNPSEEKLNYARQIFSQPPLLYDPLKRDCARLSHDYAESFRQNHNFSSDIHKKLKTLCPRAEALNWTTPPPTHFSITKNGSDRLSEDEFLFYSNLRKSSFNASNTRKIAQKILDTWKHAESSRSKIFKSRLEWELIRQNF